MAHEKAKQVLQQACTPEELDAAVRAAFAEGMALSEIEEFLDWLDARRRWQSGKEPDSTADSGG